MKKKWRIFRRWNKLPCSWKMVILQKAIYRFNLIPIKCPAQVFYRYWKDNFSIHMETPSTAKTIQNTKRIAGSTTILISSCTTEILIKIVDISIKTYIDQWSWTRTQTKIYVPINIWFLIKKPETHTEKDSIFNKWCWLMWIAKCARILIDLFLPPAKKTSAPNGSKTTK